MNPFWDSANVDLYVCSYFDPDLTSLSNYTPTLKRTNDSTCQTSISSRLIRTPDHYHIRSSHRTNLLFDWSSGVDNSLRPHQVYCIHSKEDIEQGLFHRSSTKIGFTQSHLNIHLLCATSLPSPSLPRLRTMIPL
jgi:hypothetical protein